MSAGYAAGGPEGRHLASPFGEPPLGGPPRGVASPRGSYRVRGWVRARSSRIAARRRRPGRGRGPARVRCPGPPPRRGPPRPGRPQASAVSWHSSALRAPPPTMCTTSTGWSARRCRVGYRPPVRERQGVEDAPGRLGPGARHGLARGPAGLRDALGHPARGEEHGVTRVHHRPQRRSVPAPPAAAPRVRDPPRRAGTPGAATGP